MPSPRLVALALLLACTPQPEPAPAATTTPPAAPPASLAPPAAPPTDPPAAPAPSPPADADAPEQPAPIDAPQVAQPATPVPADALRFHVAALRDGPLDLHLLGDDVFVSGSGGLAHLDRRGRLVNLEYGLSGQATPEYGFDGWYITALGGVWPDNAWLVSRYYQARSASPPHLHRRDGNAWRAVANKDGALYWYYTHILTWHSGQVLGLRAYLPDPELGGDLEDMPKKTRARVTAQLAGLRRGFDLLGETPTPTAMVLDPAIRVTRDLAAAPTGELHLLGRGDDDDGPQHLQRWALDGSTTTVQIPRKLDCSTLAVRSADDVYLGCMRDTPDSTAAHILRFDSSTLTDLDAVPPGRAVRQLAVAATGELWAIVAGHRDDPTALWRRPRPDAAWERIALPALRFPDLARPTWSYDHGPEQFVRVPADPDSAASEWPLEPTGLLVRGPADVWIVATTQLRRGELGGEPILREVVLRTVAAEPLAMLSDADLYLEALDWRPAPAWKPGDGCVEGIPAFTVLRTLPANSPRDQPEPALAAFVRDNPDLRPRIRDIFEVHRRGRRAIGLFVELPDQPAADALLAALERAAPGEPRSLECRRPRARRKFDVATGLVVPD